MVATLATLAALPVLVNGLTSAKQGAAPVAAVPGGADIADSLRDVASQAPSAAKTTVPAQRSNLPRATSPTQPVVLDIAIPQTLPAQRHGAWPPTGGSVPRMAHRPAQPPDAARLPRQGGERRQRP